MFLGGYAVLVLLYVAAVVCRIAISTGRTVRLPVLFGIYYAATEGILMALASAVIPPAHRTSGIAIVGTGDRDRQTRVLDGLRRAVAGIGIRDAVIVFVIVLGVALAVSLALMRATDHDS